MGYLVHSLSLDITNYLEASQFGDTYIYNIQNSVIVSHMPKKTMTQKEIVLQNHLLINNVTHRVVLSLSLALLKNA